MTAVEDQTAAGPAIVEGPGRYKVSQAPDGAWIVARALPLCDRCASCGCGDQAEPITVPAMALTLARQLEKSGGANPLKMLAGLKGLVGRA